MGFCITSFTAKQNFELIKLLLATFKLVYTTVDELLPMLEVSVEQRRDKTTPATGLAPLLQAPLLEFSRECICIDIKEIGRAKLLYVSINRSSLIFLTVDSSSLLRRLFQKLISFKMPTTAFETVPVSPSKQKLAVALSQPANVLKFVRISSKAHAPTKGSPLAAGYDLYSAVDVVSLASIIILYLLENIACLLAQPQLQHFCHYVRKNILFYNFKHIDIF